MWILGLLKNKWVIGSLVTLIGAAVAGGSIWIKAQQDGFEDGFSKAGEMYQDKVQEIVTGVVESRDAEWASRMEQIRDEINAIVQQNERTAEQEQELRDRLAAIQEQLGEDEQRIRTSNLGSCNLSPEFDSLFDDTGPEPADPGPAPSGEPGSP